MLTKTTNKLKGPKMFAPTLATDPQIFREGSFVHIGGRLAVIDTWYMRWCWQAGIVVKEVAEVTEATTFLTV